LRPAEGIDLKRTHPVGNLLPPDWPALSPRVGTRQLIGLEINTCAHELAQAVVWIGYLQWLGSNGFPPGSRDPNLEPLDTIWLKDALLDRGSQRRRSGRRRISSSGTRRSWVANACAWNSATRRLTLHSPSTPSLKRSRERTTHRLPSSTKKGFATSLTPSAMRLTLTTVRSNASPGNTDIHQAICMNGCALLSMYPQLT
jgi:hypothetical protein